MRGGAWPFLRKAYQLHLGGLIGSGDQPFPWVHRMDVVRTIRFLQADFEDRLVVEGPASLDEREQWLSDYLEQETMLPQEAQIYNVAVPTVLTQREAVYNIQRYLGRRHRILRIPRQFPQLAMGELAQVVLGGQRVYPKALLQKGFLFRYHTLERALPTLF